MKRLLLVILIFQASLISIKGLAQQHRILSDDIASLEVMAGDDWLHLPVIRLDSNVPLNIGFDDLSHQERRLRYEIKLLNYDWTENEELFPSEYLEGVSDHLFIEDIQQSLGTATLYTHYSIQIPNDNVRLKLSGNYCLSVYDDNNNDETPLLQAFFMASDQRMSTSMSYTADTDIDVRKTHQQVEMTVNFGQCSVTDPERQLHTVVMQNNRWRDAVHDAPWQFRTPTSLRWQHCRPLIFEAGNEQHKFEFLDLHRNSMGVESTGFDGENYDVYVQTDVPRPNYVYDKGGQGAFVIRNTDNTEVDYTSEYFVAHFACSPVSKIGADGKTSLDNQLSEVENGGGALFIDGLWTHESLSPEYQLQYNSESNLYEASIPLKMGYYSYRYLLRHPDGKITLAPFEGSYYETQNTYQSLIYFRPVGGRSDLLVSYSTIE